MNDEQSIYSLIQTIAKLRDPIAGCPWDLEQTHESLLPYLFEESYEFKEALKLGDRDEIKNELGDILLQVVLHSQLASEKNSFHFYDVCDHLQKKIVERHPHVFKDVKILGTEKITKEQVEKQWIEIKAKTNSTKSHFIHETMMPNKLLYHAPLESAERIGKKSAQVDFDWTTPQEVLQKVREELAELEDAITRKEASSIKEEMGDLLFSLAQLARHLNFSSEESLELSNQKFIKRFRAMEQLCVDKKIQWEDLSSSEKENLWREVKSHEKT
ncbi:MAG: nucleoside triphosphate pyrophosphohydrolase [Bacteriovoracaceae bacterium]|nr:nucleoside triphosphate pyrophosphohydrolase [Bacteriovoracaceae bacterium]